MIFLRASSLEVHLYVDLISELLQDPRVKISLNLRVLGEAAEHDVLSVELCLVLEEAVGQEHGDEVTPSVGRCCGEKDPVLSFGDLEERIHPGTRPNHPLLVEDEESIPVDVLFDVVPAVHM